MPECRPLVVALRRLLANLRASRQWEYVRC
jgi:hypothetical protein